MQERTLPASTGKRESASVSELQAALQYAAWGWPVIPLHSPAVGGCSCGEPKCNSIGKHPRNSNGATGGTTRVEVIRQWWTRWPHANVGIVTGKVSGLCVLDVDGIEGQASLGALEATQTLPATRKVLTGRTDPNGTRTGFHLYFHVPPARMPSGGVGRLGKGLDIRGAGNYVVSAPSLHGSGLLYEWADIQAEIADLPEWILEKLTAAKDPALEAGELLFKGERRNTLFRFACRCRRAGQDQPAIYRALVAENVRRCHPLVEDFYLQRMAASAAKYPAGGLDPLDVAWAAVSKGEHATKEAHLFALACRLQVGRPGKYIALPQVRIGELMGCDPTLVSRYRRRLVADGRLILRKPYVKGKLAAMYSVPSLS